MNLAEVTASLKEIAETKSSNTNEILGPIEGLENEALIPEELWRNFFDPELIAYFEEVLEVPEDGSYDLRDSDLMVVWGSSAEQFISGGSKRDENGAIQGRNIGDYDIKTWSDTRRRLQRQKVSSSPKRGRTADFLQLPHSTADITHLGQLQSENTYILRDIIMPKVVEHATEDEARANPQNPQEKRDIQTKYGAKINAIHDVYPSGSKYPPIAELLAKDVMYRHEVNSIVFRKKTDGNLEARILKPSEKMAPIIHDSYRAEVLRQLANFERDEVQIDSKEMVRIAEVAGRAVKYCARTGKDINFEQSEPGDYAALKTFTSKVIAGELVIKSHPDCIYKNESAWEEVDATTKPEPAPIEINGIVRDNLRKYIAQGFEANPAKTVEYGFEKLPLAALLSTEFAKEFEDQENAHRITERMNTLSNLLYGTTEVTVINPLTKERAGVKTEMEHFPTNMTQVMVLVLNAVGWDERSRMSDIEELVANWNNGIKQNSEGSSINGTAPGAHTKGATEVGGKARFDRTINLDLLLMGIKGLREGLEKSNY